MSSRYGLRGFKQSNSGETSRNQKVYRINIDDLQKSKQEHKIFKASRISRKAFFKEQFIAGVGAFMIVSCATTFLFNPLYHVFKTPKQPTKLITEEDPESVALNSLTQHKNVESWDFRTAN